MREGFERVTFWRRPVINNAVEVHVMPRHRSLLPELARRRAHLVGPVRRLVEALAGAQDLLDVGTGEAAQLRVGDRRDDSVTRLAPGECGRGTQRRGGDERDKNSDT